MAFEPVTIGTFAGLTKILDYLRPTRSPYLTAIGTAFICFVFIKSQIEFTSEIKIFYYIMPSLAFYVVFSIAPIIFFFKSASNTIPDDEKLDISEQFKFSRSIFVSIILISLYIITTSYGTLNWIFYVSYAMMVINLLVFSFYLLTREIREDDKSNRNLIQIALINSIIILLIAQYAPAVNTNDGILWLDCKSTVKFEHDERDENLSVVVDENNAPVRTQSDVELENCYPDRAEFEAKATEDDLLNPKFLEGITVKTNFSFTFLIFFASYLLSILYFCFWISRIGSVVKLSIVG